MSRARITEGLKNADLEDIENIIIPAIQIERAWYEEKGHFEDYVREKQLVFKLRKALEGIWGHDLPEVEGE